jgi:hypothetical protein
VRNLVRVNDMPFEGRDSEMAEVSAPSPRRDASEDTISSRDIKESNQNAARPVNTTSTPSRARNGNQSEHLTSPSTQRNGQTPFLLSNDGPNGRSKDKDSDISPTKLAAKQIKFHKEVARLQDALDNVSTDVARSVLHSNWRRFIFEDYDEIHISFILRAILKNATLDVLTRVARDGGLFKGPMLNAAVESKMVIDSVLEKVAKDGGLFKGPMLQAALGNKMVINSVISDLDNVPLLANHMSPDDLLSTLPQAFVDKAIANRIGTVDSRQLVIWLASAGRLGYRNDDLIGGDEIVTPNPAIAESTILSKDQEAEALGIINSLGGADFPMRPPPFVPPPPPPRPVSALQRPLVCEKCKQSFASLSGYNYHTTKTICEKSPPSTGHKWRCENCFQGFTTKQGREYHNLKHVCEHSDIQPASDSPAESPQPGRSIAPHTMQRPPMKSQASRKSQDHQAGAQHQFPSPAIVNAIHDSIPGAPLTRPPMYSPISTPSTPLGTSSKKQRADGDIRQPPENLPPERLAAMNREIEEEDTKYEALKQEIMQMAPEEHEHRLQSAKNGNASKKSNIRKRYGVTLRMREKDKIATGKKVTSSKLRASFSAPEETLTPRSYAAPPPPSSTSPVQMNTIVPAPQGFLPINAAHGPEVRTNSSWSNTLPPSSMQNSYGSPYAPSYIPDNHVAPYSYQPPSSSSPRATMGSANKNGTSIKQKPVNYAPHNQQTPASYAVNNMKRRRSDSHTGDESSARPSPAYRTPYELIPTSSTPTNGSIQLQMKEVSSQPAAAKFPKKILTEPQRKWQAMRPSQSASNSPAASPAGSTVDVTMSDAPAADVDSAPPTVNAPTNDEVVPTTETPSSGSKTESVIALSESESDDDEDIPNDNS